MNATDSTTRGSVPERQPSGWVIFAGVALLIVGPLDALYGLAAILNNQIVIVGGNGVIVADITTWGWVHLILGSLVALAGLGLFAGMSSARWAAVFFVAVNAVSQIVWFPAAPTLGDADDSARRDHHLPVDGGLGGLDRKLPLGPARETRREALVPRPVRRHSRCRRKGGPPWCTTTDDGPDHKEM
jgi:hypothetical protein